MKKQYTTQQKAQLVMEMLKEEKTITQISSDNGVHSSQLYKWKTQAVENFTHYLKTTTKTI